MPQINTSLPENLIKELQKIAKKTNKSFSKTVCDIVELGLKIYEKQGDLQNQEELRKKQELEEKHTEYLLRISAYCIDILRCVINEKSKYSGKNMDEIMELVKNNVQEQINRYIEKG